MKNCFTPEERRFYSEQFEAQYAEKCEEIEGEGVLKIFL